MLWPLFRQCCTMDWCELFDCYNINVSNFVQSSFFSWLMKNSSTLAFIEKIVLCDSCSPISRNSHSSFCFQDLSGNLFSLKITGKNSNTICIRSEHLNWKFTFYWCFSTGSMQIDWIFVSFSLASNENYFIKFTHNFSYSNMTRELETTCCVRWQNLKAKTCNNVAMLKCIEWTNKLFHIVHNAIMGSIEILLNSLQLIE